MIEYNEDCLISLLFKYRGAVMYRGCYFAFPSAMLTLVLLYLDELLPDLRRDANLMDLGGSTVWSAAGAALVFAIAFRTNRAILRFWEGTGLLHQMRGEWFDTVSNCISFSIKAGRERKKIKKVLEFRHTLVRLMSLCHGYALEEISGDQFEIPTIDVHGLDRSTRRYLKLCNESYKFNKVEMTLHLIQSLIVDAHNEGIIDIPAPILSRVFQTISRGFVHLLNTKKITDTKFPFPYTQLIAVLLILASILTPFLLSSFILNKFIAVVLTFIPIFAMASLNYIAIEIENPFGRDDNDLPMDVFQKEMDSCLLMLLHPFADTIPTVGHSCIYDFNTLINKFGSNTQKEDLDECANPGTKPNNAQRRFATEIMAQDSEQDLTSSSGLDTLVVEALARNARLQAERSQSTLSLASPEEPTSVSGGSAEESANGTRKDGCLPKTGSGLAQRSRSDLLNICDDLEDTSKLFRCNHDEKGSPLPRAGVGLQPLQLSPSRSSTEPASKIQF